MSRSTSSDGSTWLPAQPHSTVRSLFSRCRQMPWSTPYTPPSTPSRACPPLRSALLRITSSTAMRCSRGSSAWTRTTSVPSRSRARRTGSQPGGTASIGHRSTRSRRPGGSAGSGVSIHRCTMPVPKGPSRSTVVGMTPQPRASETR
ncbi:hypothetical protein GQ85_29090 [Rhodococcus rhodochrous]|nr:hypothetical protein GQ85_29090 [Rhodococcus rhodochrous]